MAASPAPSVPSPLEASGLLAPLAAPGSLRWASAMEVAAAAADPQRCAAGVAVLQALHHLPAKGGVAAEGRPPATPPSLQLWPADVAGLLRGGSRPSGNPATVAALSAHVADWDAELAARAATTAALARGVAAAAAEATATAARQAGRQQQQRRQPLFATAAQAGPPMHSALARFVGWYVGTGATSDPAAVAAATPAQRTELQRQAGWRQEVLAALEDHTRRLLVHAARGTWGPSPAVADVLEGIEAAEALLALQRAVPLARQLRRFAEAQTAGIMVMQRAAARTTSGLRADAVSATVAAASPAALPPLQPKDAARVAAAAGRAAAAPRRRTSGGGRGGGRGRGRGRGRTQQTLPRSRGRSPGRSRPAAAATTSHEAADREAASARGWKRVPVGARAAMPPGCFGAPEERKYVVCPQGSTRVSCAGIVAAARHAKFQHRTDVTLRLRELAQMANCDRLLASGNGATLLQVGPSNSGRPSK